MTNTNYLTTLSAVMEKLRLKKQDKEFIMTKKGFGTEAKTYRPDELVIIKTYRFEGDSDPSDNSIRYNIELSEGDSDPSDNSILYLIEANDGSIGYTLDAYGVYSNHEGDGYDDFIRKIPVMERTEQQIFGDDKL